MNVTSLRQWIKTTREVEGVNWYLRDSTPIHDCNKLFNLVVYDSEGNIVQRINHIEPRRGAIPSKFLMQISAARIEAGINAHFAEAIRKAGKDPVEEHAKFRAIWLETGQKSFVDGVVASSIVSD
jgi:hypothetical protein